MGRQMAESPMFRDLVYYSTMIAVAAALTYGLFLNVNGILG